VVPADGPHVLVAGDRPEPGPFGLRMAIDGGVLPKPPELLVGLAGSERRRIEKVDDRVRSLS